MARDYLLHLEAFCRRIIDYHHVQTSETRQAAIEKIRAVVRRNDHHHVADSGWGADHRVGDAAIYEMVGD